MGTTLAIEAFERDVTLVEAAGLLLRDLAPLEAEVRALIARKARRGVMPRVTDWMRKTAAIV